MAPGDWIYTGSAVEGAAFMAEAEGSIIAIYLDHLAPCSTCRARAPTSTSAGRAPHGDPGNRHERHPHDPGRRKTGHKKGLNEQPPGFRTYLPDASHPSTDESIPPPSSPPSASPFRSPPRTGSPPDATGPTSSLKLRSNGPSPRRRLPQVAAEQGNGRVERPGQSGLHRPRDLLHPRRSESRPAKGLPAEVEKGYEFILSNVQDDGGIYGKDSRPTTRPSP